MKKYLSLLIIFLCCAQFSNAQVICSNNGSIVLFTNYDGGTLNIDVDINMPNLKIGIVSYEAVNVNLTGAFLNNVTAVHYAGYNSANTNCNPAVPTTVINGAPGGATVTIVNSPPSPLANVNGNPNIICGYSCTTNVAQGGCNTVDQIVAYFNNIFPGSILRQHKVQYACWTGTQNISGGGTCCPGPVGPPMLVSVSATQPSCPGACDGSATATVIGGTPPYTYQWIGGPASPTYTNLCPGTYTVTVMDGGANSATGVVTIMNPAPINTNLNQSACFSYFFNGNNITASGTYYDTLQSAAGCDSNITLNLTINTVDVNVNQSGSMLTAVATGATYQWINCSNAAPVAGATSQSFTPAQTGSYAVIVTQNGCTDTSLCKSIVISGIEQTEKNSLIDIYPNPVEHELTIKIAGQLINSHCTITDASGKVVIRQQLKSSTNKIQTSQWSKGIYFVEIEGVDKKYSIQK